MYLYLEGGEIEVRVFREKGVFFVGLGCFLGSFSVFMRVVWYFLFFN